MSLVLNLLVNSDTGKMTLENRALALKPIETDIQCTVIFMTMKAGGLAKLSGR